MVLVGVRLITEDERASFTRIVGTDVVVEETGPNVTLNLPAAPIHLMPQRLALPKERIALDLQADRTTIIRDYPLKDDLSRFSDVIRYAIERSDTGRLSLRAYGFNIETVYDLEEGKTALEYFSTQVFRHSLLGGSAFQLIGGKPQLSMLRDGDLWHVNIEPRFGDPTSGRLFFNWNLHYQSTKLPSPHSVRASLDKLWDQVHNFVEEVGAP